MPKTEKPIIHKMNIEQLAEQLHNWYLEATKKLKPESYNPNAQKKYQDLTDDQKWIDRFIAEKILVSILRGTVQGMTEVIVKHLRKELRKEFGEDMMKDIFEDEKGEK